MLEQQINYHCSSMQVHHLYSQLIKKYPVQALSQDLTTLIALMRSTQQLVAAQVQSIICN